MPTSYRQQNLDESLGNVASYPGLPSQLFLQPWKKALFSTAAKKAVREGLGTRLGK